MDNRGMKKHVMRAAACFLAGSMTAGALGAPAMASGLSMVGVAEISVEDVAADAEDKEDTVLETAAEDAEPEDADVADGVGLEAADIAENADAAQDAAEETEAAPIEELLNTVAIAQPGEDSFVYIRSEATTESDVVGKLYNNNAATIIGEEGDWYLVQSGNCQGYVAKYLLTTGEDAQTVVAEVGTPVAQVNAEALMVRADASEEADTVDMVTENDIVYLEEDLGDWALVSTGNGNTGYVSADYVSYATYLPQAESVEEEAARIEAENEAWEAYLAEQEAAYQAEMERQEAEYEAYLAQQQAEWEAQNQAWIEYLESQGAYADQAQANADQAYADQAYADQLAADAQAAADEAYWSGDEQAAADAQAYADQLAAEAQAAADAAAQAQAEADAAAAQAVSDAGIDASQVDTTSSLRQQIVDYALQFVGNPYVWGGTSLTNGADCSGFTQSVMADNGISINRTAGAQSQGGTSVALDDIQPGDLLFYSGNGDYGIGHVSMYIGDGKVVHASNSTDGIIVSDIDYRTPVSAKSYINE